MATKEEVVTDPLWEEMKILAIEQQQCLYELLPDCTEYKTNEHKYLKQNIGYAIYGPPENTKNASTTENNESCCYYNTENLNDTDAGDTVDYNEKAQKVIDMIYNKIRKCTVDIDESQLIYFGTIYNMLFRPKKNKTKTKVKEEAKENELLIVSSIPVFTIRKGIQKKSDPAKSAKQGAVEMQYETWYIDIGGRVYKSWTDYTRNNNLPKCTMVLPKHGFYQANPFYPVTEDCSTVWLEIMYSPACTVKAKIFRGMDIFSNVVGFGTLGLGAVSLFTPLAPVVAVAGLAAAGVTGVYTIGRNSRQLADRSSHEESIHLFNKEAFPCYLGIAGTAFGLGAMGGSVIISKVAARGMAVNIFARAAFNTVQGGNLLLNGVGMIYQGYYIIDKYKNGESVTIGDAVNLATHIMFFYGSVVKIQFANDIIKSTQGRVINDYKENLSSKRLRKKYNRAVRNAAENNTCKISENAEVIRYIKDRHKLLSNQSVTKGGSQISDNTSRNIAWSFKDGKLKVNNIILLDPIEYVIRLIRLGIFIEIDQNKSDSQNYANNSIGEQLTKVLSDLLSKLYTSDDSSKITKLPIVPDFAPLIRDMSSMNINEDCLRMLFKIVEKLMKRSKDMDEFLLLTFTFVWQYCKANLEKWGLSVFYCVQSVSSCKILQKIIIAVFEAIDMVVGNLYNAFAMYIQFARTSICTDKSRI